MTTWYRACFLFSSFKPLYLLVCVGLTVQGHWQTAGMHSVNTIAMATSGMAFLLSLIVFARLRTQFTAASPSRYAIEPLETLDESVLSYMLSYLPPLLIDDFTSVAKVVPTVVFYAVFFLILAKTDTMYVNPYFLLFGYRIYRVRLQSTRVVVVITRGTEMISGTTVTLYEIQPSKMFFVA